MKSISVLTSLYKSEDFIVEFINETRKNLINNKCSNFEFIIVNDGTPDSSVQKIEENFKSKNLNIKIINLSRNFGHHKALITGLKHCTKDFVFLIDCDLEVNPNCLTKFLELMSSDDSIDCAYGVSDKKNKFSMKNFVTTFLSKIFAKIFIYFSNYNYNKKAVHARLMKKKFANEIIKCEHSNPFLLELYEFVGFNQKYLNIEYNKRKSSSYTLKKKFELFFYFFLSNSEKILKIYFLLSLFLVFISFGLIINFFYNYFFLQLTAGYTSTVLLISTFGSLTLLGVSLCCLYIQQVFLDLKKLPNTIISSIIEL
jgi:putative glycosyltransferase